MKNFVRLLLAVTLFIYAGCSSKETKTCQITELIWNYVGITTPYFKYAASYDGADLKELREYYYNTSAGKWNETPERVTTYSYTDGQLSKEITQAGNSSSNIFFQRTYSYSHKDDTTIIEIRTGTLKNGVLEDEHVFISKLPEIVKDGIYFLKDILGTPRLEQYENGNLVKMALQSPTGTYTAYGATWTFFYSYEYDNKPNFYVDNHLLGNIINILPNSGRCKNNVLRQVYTFADGSQQVIGQSFDTGLAGQLEKYHINAGTLRIWDVVYSCQ